MTDRKRSFNSTNLPNINDNLNLLNNNLPNISTSGSSSSQQIFEDSLDDINHVISCLATPTDNVPTYVSRYYNNESIVGNEVQAYAKIAGCNWTYYVKDLKISIGRNAEVYSNPNVPTNVERIDIDLGPSKVVSRKHASIEYHLSERKWQLFILGRNGLKVNGIRLNLSPNTPYDLSSGNIIDIGGTQMMFILPDATPVIPDAFRYLLNNKKVKLNSISNNNRLIMGSNASSSKSDIVNNQVKAFQLQEGISALHPNAGSNDQDYSKDDAKDLKPPYSYATMITQAILSNPQGILSLSEIYDWISNHFAYYRHTKQGWQNSIRHNLSLNKAFEKVPRKPNEPGKGMKWQISESYRNEFLKKWEDGSLNKIRRGTSVSRQLQLHLIKNNALPKGRESPNREAPHEYNNMSENNSHIPNQLYDLPNISPNKNDLNYLPLKNDQNSTLTSPIKTMSIPEINYLNNDPKLSSGLVSGLNTTNTSDQLLHISSAPAHSGNNAVNHNTINDNNNGNNIIDPSNNTNDNDNNSKTSNSNNDDSNKNTNNGTSNNNNNTNNNNHPQIDKQNDNTLGRSYQIPSIKTQTNDDNPLTSPKKMFHRMDLMTPERNVLRPNLEPPSVNSSPALWNYVQFSTPLDPNTGNNGGNNNNLDLGNGDVDRLSKIELESPLKNRKILGKISDLKDVDLAKGFKQ